MTTECVFREFSIQEITDEEELDRISQTNSTTPFPMRESRPLKRISVSVPKTTFCAFGIEQIRVKVSTRIKFLTVGDKSHK